MALYVGMDVHRKRSQVAILDDRGGELLNRNVANDPAALLPILGKLPSGTPVAFEATYGWGWLVELLSELGLEPHLAHPTNCKAIASARLKDDRIDARTLAHLLRANLLAEAWIAPREVRDLRALLRHRAFLVCFRTALKARIHAVLADQGMHLQGSLWTKRGRKGLAALPLPTVQREIVDDGLTLIDTVAVLIARLEAEILDRATYDPRVEALQRVPGIGCLTAMMIVAEVGDVARFPSARKLCAWAGLTPIVRNSARKVRHGHISKQGSRWVRFMLTQAAQQTKYRPPFARAYAEIAHRRGHHIATIAIARRVLARCYHILKEVRDHPTQHNGADPQTG